MKVDEAKFNRLKVSDKCDCCGKETDIVTVTKTFNNDKYTYNICLNCMEKELVPYNTLVYHANKLKKLNTGIEYEFMKSIKQYLIEYCKTEEDILYDISNKDLRSLTIFIMGLIGNGIYYEGKYIKNLILQYISMRHEEDYNEITVFYQDYIEGKTYFPISDTTKYRLDWVQSSIVPTSEFYKN